MSTCALPVHPYLMHPLTGAPLQALGLTRRGPIWPVMGGAPDDGAAGGDGAGQQGGAGDAGGQQAAGGDAGSQQAGAQGAAGQQQADAGDGASKQEVKDLPAWAQKLIADTRKEAGDARVAGKTAAETAQKELTDKLAEALGLKPDSKTDPAELAKQVATAQTEAKNTAVQLAVFQAATKPALAADAAALLDSNSFMTKVNALDHKAADFLAKVEAEIKTAVTSNPKLKAVQAAGASGGQHSGSAGEGKTRPTSLSGAIAAHQQHAAG